MQRRLEKTISLLVAGIGLALLVMMIIVEDEFGALPLMLLVGGSAWYGKCRMQERSANR